jgi:hypothetical protein
MAKDNEIVISHCRSNDLAKRIPADHKPIKSMRSRSIARAITAGRPHTKRKVHKLLRPNKPMKNKKTSKKKDKYE